MSFMLSFYPKNLILPLGIMLLMAFVGSETFLIKN